MKNGKLFLGGGGDANTSFDFDEQFFFELPHQASLLYIPIALHRESIGYESCIDWFSALVARHSEGKEIDFETALENIRVTSLNKFDAVYIGGGNTYHLLNYINDAGMREHLAEYVQEGGSIYGGSAGAIVLGKDIRTVEEENHRGSTHHNGLNMLGGMSVLCHYKDSMKERAASLAASLYGPILAIPENSGVIWIGDHIERCVGKISEFQPEGTVKRI